MVYSASGPYLAIAIIAAQRPVDGLKAGFVSDILRDLCFKA